MSSLTFKWVFVTGGSSGIGYAIAQQAVQQKSNVVLIARNPERLNDAVLRLQQLPEVSNLRIESVALDVSNRNEVYTRLPEVVKNCGYPDLIVNCAGEAFPEYFEAIPDDIFEKTIDVHVKGTWYVIRTLLPYLKITKGTIINVSSIAGITGIFGYTAYSAAKAAIIGFSEALRSELFSYGIQVAVLCPPDTKTPGFDRENQTKPPETRAISANAGVLSPEQVAKSLFHDLQKKKFLIIPGIDGRFTVMMMHHFPGIVQWVMDREIQKSQKLRR
jgi:short-subunit dehydrogenase